MSKKGYNTRDVKREIQNDKKRKKYVYSPRRRASNLLC
mgnify:CR=1 FL=1